MAVLHRVYVGPKQSVVLVRIADRIVVVGVSGQQMTALSEITDAFEVADVVARLEGVPGAEVTAPTALDERELARIEADVASLLRKLRQLKGEAGEESA